MTTWPLCTCQRRMIWAAVFPYFSEDIFLVTKLWPTVYEKETAVEETLARLGTGYIDLLFLHQPTANWREGYKTIEKAVKAGKVKAG